MKEYKILKSTTQPQNTDVLWYDQNTHTLKHFYPKDNGWEGVGVSNQQLEESLGKYLPLSGGTLGDSNTNNYIKLGPDTGSIRASFMYIDPDGREPDTLCMMTFSKGIITLSRNSDHISNTLSITPYEGIILDSSLGNETGFWKVQGGSMSISDLEKQIVTSGTTLDRPNEVDISNTPIPIGFCYFDTTLGKPIWLKSSVFQGTKVWVDATGTAV